MRVEITDEQRRVLIDHAMECNRADGGNAPAVELRFADVLVDLAADRPVADRGLFVRFLWQRVSFALLGLEYGSRDVAAELRAWSAAVGLLDQLGEDRTDIFVGRAVEATAESEQAKLEQYEALKREVPDPSLADIAGIWGLPLEVAESIAEHYGS